MDQPARQPFAEGTLVLFRLLAVHRLAAEDRRAALVERPHDRDFRGEFIGRGEVMAWVKVSDFRLPILARNGA